MAHFSSAATAIVFLLALSLASAQSNATATASDGKLTGVCAETNPGDKKITLECPAGTIIKRMKAASWGQNPGGCPSVKRHSKCTLDITDFMEHYCNMSNKCPVTVAKEILGLPVDKQRQECLQDEVPFTFVASFYCGVAGWNDVAPAPAAMEIMPMDSGDNVSTPEPESTPKPHRSAASSVSVSVLTVALVLLSSAMA